MQSLFKFTNTSILFLILSAGNLFADPISEAQKAYMLEDYTKADNLIRPLAENGDILAQYNLGVMYANEKSKIHDYQEAAKWFRMAADQGDTDAQVWLGAAYAGGRGVTWDYKKAIDWYRLAGNQGHIDAQL